MSKLQKPCLYEGQALDNQWMNNIYNSHDLFCGCLDPIKHLQGIVARQQCRRTKDAETSTGETKENHGIDFAIDGGDLEKLFEEKDDEER